MGINASEWMLAAILILFFFLTGKGWDWGGNSLKGHWISEDGSRMSFDGTSEVLIDFNKYEYTLLYDSKMTITGEDATFFYSYEAEHDALTLTDVYSNITKIYHRDKDRNEELS